MNEKEKLINDNLPLIGYVINRLGLNFDYEELYHVGLVGLIKGANSYDKSKNVAPCTYLYRCIQNEIYKHGRKKQHEIDTIPLDTKIGCDELTIENIISNNENHIEDLIFEYDIDTLYKAIDKLTPVEQVIINNLYGLYGEDSLTQIEVGNLVGLSQAQISRQRQSILHKLKWLIISIEKGKTK